MPQEKQYPFLKDLVKPFRKTQQESLLLVLLSIVQVGQARTVSICQAIAFHLRIRLDSAINRFYRLLRNKRLDEVLWVSQWLSCLCSGSGSSLLVCLDWTEWPHNLRLLVAAVVVRKRAIPLKIEAYPKQVSQGSQNQREHLFIRFLSLAVRELGIRVTLLCDRGFRRVSFLKLLKKLSLDFVVRIMEDVTVHLPSGTSLKLSEVLLPQGVVVDLGEVMLRSDRATTVRLVAYLAKGSKEPWFLATSRKDPAMQIVKLYDRRMTVEEQFRDVKGTRFGVKLSWTHFRDPAQLAWMVRLVAVALLIWICSGKRVSVLFPSFLWSCKKKGPRLSFTTLGIFACNHFVDPQALGPPFTLGVLRREWPTLFLRPLASLSGAAK